MFRRKTTFLQKTQGCKINNENNDNGQDTFIWTIKMYVGSYKDFRSLPLAPKFKAYT